MLKNSIKAGAIFVLVAIITTIFTFNTFTFAEEIDVEQSNEQIVFTEDQQYKPMSLDDGGLKTFGIQSDPGAGGTHPGATRSILCAAIVDVYGFQTSLTDYIVINWDASEYRVVEGSVAIQYIAYYEKLDGYNESVERTGKTLFLQSGVLVTDFSMDKLISDIPLLYNKLLDFYCFIYFELEPTSVDKKVPIYANYYHCTQNTSITGIGFSDTGFSLNWSTQSGYNPIWGEMTYIWD